MDERILRLPAVKERTGLSRSSVYEKIAARDFPKPIALGARAVGWLESDIDAWIDRRVAASRSTRSIHHGLDEDRMKASLGRRLLR